MRFDFSMYAHYGDMYYVNNWNVLIEEICQQALICEEIGMSTFWVPEHHFAGIDGWNNAAPNPILLCMYLAAKTNKLRIGTGGVSLPDWHPLRVAEDIALLDNASNGRVDVGVMRGGSKRTNVQFNKNQSDPNKSRKVFEESLEIIKSAWTSEAFTYSGEFYTFPVPGWVESHPDVRASRKHYGENGEYIALNLHPKPLQKPTPPIWMLSNSIHAHRQAGKNGLNIMSYCLHLMTLKENGAAYREAAGSRRAGAGGTEGLAVMRPFYMAATDEAAFARARPGINATFGRSSVTVQGKKSFLPEGQELSQQDIDDDWFDFLMRHNQLFVGSPARVREQIQAHRDIAACDHVALMGNISGLTREEVESSLRLCGDEVLSHFN